MMRSLMGGIAAVALMSGAAFAQNSYSSSTTTVTQTAPSPMAQPLPPPPMNGPSYNRTTTVRQVDPSGVETERTESVQKQQSYSDQDGMLGAQTTTRTQSSVTTASPPPPPPTALVPPDQEQDQDDQTAAAPGSTVSTTTYRADGRPMSTTVITPNNDDQ